MKYIIQISTLIDNYCDMEFGYIGRDIKTGELHYYAMLDKEGNYSSYCLTEFNINAINQENNREWLICHLNHSNYKGSKEKDSELPEDILSLIPEMINKHLTYNKENGFPTEFITNNLANLSIEYANNVSLFGDIIFECAYNGVINAIKIPISKYQWSNYNDLEKKYAEDMLLHEAGHFKVSNHKLDIKNKQLNIKVGFFNLIVNVEPIILANGDVFLKKDDENSLDNSNGRILEEVMNDFDCRQVNPDFNLIYPKVGHILNQLCDGRLQTARYYDDGIEELYESLSKIIKSRSMVDELLESIERVSQSDDFDYEENNNHMMEILNQYQKIKRNK